MKLIKDKDQMVKPMGKKSRQYLKEKNERMEDA